MCPTRSKSRRTRRRKSSCHRSLRSPTACRCSDSTWVRTPPWPRRLIRITPSTPTAEASPTSGTFSLSPTRHRRRTTTISTRLIRMTTLATMWASRTSASTWRSSRSCLLTCQIHASAMPTSIFMCRAIRS